MNDLFGKWGRHSKKLIIIIVMHSSANLLLPTAVPNGLGPQAVHRET